MTPQDEELEAELAEDFGQSLEDIFTDRTIRSWLKGTDDGKHNFKGWDAEDLDGKVVDIKMPTGEFAVEIAPRTKRIHAHILIEIKHMASIQLDWEKMRDDIQEKLPDNLKPPDGKLIYLHISSVPTVNYVLDYIRKEKQQPTVDAEEIKDLADQYGRHRINDDDED